MRIYISSPIGHATNLPRHLLRVARLYRRGVLDENSTVWINANVMSPIFWTLSSRSTCMYWFDAPTSGTVRLTKDRIRWAPTYNASGSSPDLELTLDSLPVDAMKHVTFVVDHGHSSEEPVQVVEGADSKRPVNGFHQGAHASVLDLGTYARQADEGIPAARRFATSLGYVHGTKLLAAGMPREVQAALEEQLELYGVDFDGNTLALMCEAVSVFEKVSANAMQVIADQAATPQLPPTAT
ncbi:hypothetical protein EEB14_33960 [Rhodococcus sp. WS4]|nr:hypothetical protein EEB14_33960 [Rhodococcus sp. WS4]